MILSVFIIGLGNIYNGLYRRGIVEFGLAVMIGFILGEILSAFDVGLFILFIIEFIWWAYNLYDTMECTDAINENKKIPYLLNNFDLQ